MPRFCIIGGSGFIGSHITAQLTSIGHDAIVVGRRSIGEVTFESRVKYFSCDYGDSKRMKSILSESDFVICLAHSNYPVDVGTSIKNRDQNTIAMESLLGVMPKSIKKFIYLSSGGAVYGRSNDFPLKETVSTKPISGYGHSKLKMEEILLDRFNDKNLPVIILRPGNVYGPGQNPFRGQGFVQTAIARTLLNQPIQLYGRRGTIRDYVYISDFVNAIEKTIKHGQIGQIYNVGTGMGIDNIHILEILEKLAQIDGYRVNVDVLPERDFDVPINYLDSSLLTNHTGWRPSVSLDDGIKLTWDWYKDNINRFK